MRTLNLQNRCSMSQSSNSGLLKRKIDWNYSNMKRTSALKWSVVNAIVLLVFVYDLSCKCSGHTSVLHYVELALAAAAGASLATHAVHLLPPRAAAPAPPAPSAARSPARGPVDTEELSLSLSPRAWRADRSPGADRSPPSPAGSGPRRPPRAAHTPPDEFIADRGELHDYLRQRSARDSAQGEAEAEAGAACGARGRPAPAPHYALAAAEAEPDEAAAGGPAAPQLWRRVHLDPRRLTQFNLNLRLWIHVTILERLVAAMEAADGALAALGNEARLGAVSVERLRRAPAAPALPQLLPFLEPFADQRYLVGRYRELAAGGCLSAYRWRGGGARWHDALPTDAELLLHLVATYLDAQLPAAAAHRPFSSAHVSAAPAPPPRGLALHRVTARPPHYVLVAGDDTLEVGAGRNNLLHALLLFLAVCAQRRPPALQRLHLGPAGLNMLWIIGR